MGAICHRRHLLCLQVRLVIWEFLKIRPNACHRSLPLLMHKLFRWTDQVNVLRTCHRLYQHLARISSHQRARRQIPPSPRRLNHASASLRHPRTIYASPRNHHIRIARHCHCNRHTRPLIRNPIETCKSRMRSLVWYLMEISHSVKTRIKHNLPNFWLPLLFHWQQHTHIQTRQPSVRLRNPYHSNHSLGRKRTSSTSKL